MGDHQFTEEWAIHFTDSLDGQPDNYEVLDGEPSQAVKELVEKYPGREIVKRLVSSWESITAPIAPSQ